MQIFSSYHDAKEALEGICKLWEGIVDHQKDLLAGIGEDHYSLTKYVDISHISAKDFIEKIEELPAAFISSLVSYFNSTYKVSIEKSEIEKVLLPQKPDYRAWDPDHKAEEEYHHKRQTMKLTYQQVLDQIFIQLGGRTFIERAVDEIKEACHNAVWNTYQGKQQYEVKGDTIRLLNYACSCDEWLSRTKWKATGEGKAVLRAVSHFETGVVGHYPHNIAFLLGYEDNHFSTVVFDDCEKVKQVRMFKNNRMDIKFASKDL
ncbi:MAG: hypothetical protein J6B88_02275, partial [Clostridia bacterium]|nr:hypothetical protein [Clostridia bacterium]